MTVLPITYFPPIPLFSKMVQGDAMLFEVHEHFHKQFYYNRCLIYGPNGTMKLIIPIQRRGEKMAMRDVRISYELNWKTLHWRSLEASYRRSPYFEFYEHAIAPVYADYSPEFLVDWNIKLIEILNELLGLKMEFKFTEEYLEEYENDYRKLVSPAEISVISSTKKYQQVFAERHGFLKNLSIIDLLFCEGPQYAEYLTK